MRGIQLMMKFKQKIINKTIFSTPSYSNLLSIFNMGCTSSQNAYNEEEKYYSTAKLQPMAQTTARQLPRNGTVSVNKDKYGDASKMLQAYPSHSQRQGSFHSVLSNEPSIATLCDKLELNLSVRNIPKLDLLSPSDPFIIVSLKNEVTGQWNIVGKTEIVWDNPNADFSKDIRINYMFEEVQYIKLDVYDADEQQTTNLNKHDYIGGAQFIVGDLVTANSQKLVMALEDKNGKRLKKVKGCQPIIIVRAHEIDDNYDEIEFKWSARGLPKMDMFGKIDPFFQIYRKTNDNQWSSVYKSEHIPSTYTPRWKQFKIESRRICQGDMHREILIRCWDWNRDAKPDYACEVKTTLAQLIDNKTLNWKQWDKKKGRYKDKECGQLVIEKANIIKKFSFVSFLNGGLELQLMVAIDFTGSNGDPRTSKSLHYMGPPHYESQYMKVIKSVGRVLAPYDADGAIGAFGFGANLNPQGKAVSHCFNLSLRKDTEEVDGIDGLVTAYKNCLNRVQLYGPTYFNEIISTAAAKSTGLCSQNAQSYNILLIITDGVINDMQRTMDCIVDATRLPLSIIIVGVGNADFDNMEILDADDTPLRHSRTGKYMERDIVQFVPFNEFKNQHISAIARETLEEIPGQVTSYMSQQGFHPNPPVVQKSIDLMNDDLYANLRGDDEDDRKEPDYSGDSGLVIQRHGNPSRGNPYYQQTNGSEGQITAPGH